MRFWKSPWKSPWKSLCAIALVSGLAACTDAGDEATSDGEAETLTIYSSRHYDADYALYEAFEQETGVTVNAVEADGDLLIERIKADARSSPPDLIVTVDAGRLWRADQEGLFAPTRSDVLESRIPANLRHPQGHWFALAKRARVLVYAEDRVDAAQLDGYESLADPTFDGRICARSSGNIYNISLLSALIDRWGENRAQDWATQVAGNFARDPQGGDTDQIKAVAAGECDIALVNHYYFARLAREDADMVEGLAIHWPEQGEGVHVNISGAGVAARARNPELARRFLEFATSPETQKLFPELTDEYPSVEGTSYNNALLSGLGTFKADPLPATELGRNQQLAQQIFDRSGWP